MTQDTELEPCPFCQGRCRVYFRRMSRARAGYFAECLGCGARQSKPSPSPEAAREEWNRRAPVVPQGWKLVPVEITDAMSDAWQVAFGRQLSKRVNSRGRLKAYAHRKKTCEEVAYVAMLAAAPQPPEASGHPPFEMEDGAVAVPPADPTMARFLRTT